MATVTESAGLISNLLFTTATDVEGSFVSRLSVHTQKKAKSPAQAIY